MEADDESLSSSAAREAREETGVALSPAAKVAVEDKFGNLVTAATPVTLTLSSGAFSTGSATITANTSGGIGGFMHASGGEPIQIKQWLLRHEKNV